MPHVIPNLQGTIALVTGASRGVGRGIALGLGEYGATVYVTGRTTIEGQSPGGQPGTVQKTADEVTTAGGKGIAVICDHTDDQQTRNLFARIATSEKGRLDILVNNAWGGYEKFHDGSPYQDNEPFWNQPLAWWEKNFDAGVRAHYATACLAASLMVPRRSGLIVTVSSQAGRQFTRPILYGAAKAADDRLTTDMATDLKPFNISSVVLYPGLVRTEGVLKHAQFFDLSNSESPQFQGRAIAHLWADPNRLNKTGQILRTTDLAANYGFVDIDAKQPTPPQPQ